MALLLAPDATAALSFNIRYVDDASETFASRGWLDPNSLFQRNIAAAADLWGAHFDSDEMIVVVVDSVSFAARAGGTNSLGRVLYENAAGQDVWEAGPLTRILTGDNPGESFFGFDIQLGFDASFVDNNYWFDPQPEIRTTPVPADRGDFLSVALHEFGHGFGMTGFRDYATGEIEGSVATQMDDLTYFGGNGEPIAPDGSRNPMFFRGEGAARLFGSDLPLTHKPPGHFLHSQNYFHLSACDSAASDGLEGTLMNGCALPNGQRLHITPFDLAVYADMGYPVTTLPGDFNEDGRVDAADYVVWRKGLGSIYTLTHYHVWRAHFGAAPAGEAAILASVPELPSCVLMGTALLLFARGGRNCATICARVNS